LGARPRSRLPGQALPARPCLLQRAQRLCGQGRRSRAQRSLELRVLRRGRTAWRSVAISVRAAARTGDSYASSMVEVEVGTASRTHLVNLVGGAAFVAGVGWAVSREARVRTGSGGARTRSGEGNGGAGPVLPWAARLLLLSAGLAGYRAVVAVENAADAAAAKAALAEGGEPVPWEKLRTELGL